MKITIPESIEDITLKQLQEVTLFAKKDGVTELEVSKEKVRIITGIDLSECEISQSDFEGLVESIDKALSTPAEFKQRFSLNGVEFGFHPNLDKMSSAEYYDLMTYGEETETLHNLMAILFRPIKNEDKFGNYTIKKYKGTEGCEQMKDMQLNLVNGALVFFLNLSKELQLSTQESLKEVERQREKMQHNSSKSGVGIQTLFRWLKMTS